MPIFAHATGFTWDEALMVMAPIAVVAALLFLANKRAQHLRDDDVAAAGGPVDAAAAPDVTPDVTPD